jgi:hypothetical protein
MHQQNIGGALVQLFILEAQPDDRDSDRRVPTELQDSILLFLSHTAQTGKMFHSLQYTKAICRTAIFPISCTAGKEHTPLLLIGSRANADNSNSLISHLTTRSKCAGVSRGRRNSGTKRVGDVSEVYLKPRELNSLDI